MKKFLFSFLTFIVIVLNTGCTNKGSVVTAVTTGLSFTAEISYNETELKCETVIDSNGTAKFTILAPEEIKELCFTFSSENVTASYKGLEYKFSGELPESNAVSEIYKIFKNISELENPVIKKDDSYIIKGSIDGNDYTLQLGASGLPIEISSSDGLSVIIKNATII